MTTAKLDYQAWPQPRDKQARIGRYIDREVPASGPTHVDEHVQVPVSIRSGREFEADLDREGFTFCTGEALPADLDFASVESIRAIYYEQIKDLVKRKTGCDKVLVFDHTLRNSGQQNLNVLSDTKAAAASVVRVHCDYTADSAPIRLRQLAKTESYTGDSFEEAMVEDVLAKQKRFAFINLWRSIDREHVIKVKPLAVCDYTSVDDANDLLLYELVYKDRVGENYSLSPVDAAKHRWYYYPDMTADEVIMFKVYDRNSLKAPFVFHTAFEDPATQPTDPARKSIEVRAIAVWENEVVPPEIETNVETKNNQPRPVLYDMKHSNNAARCRLWLQLKGVPEELCGTKMLTYADLKDGEFEKVNPLKKFPAMQAWKKVVKDTNMGSASSDESTTGPWNYYYESQPIFESHVIMQYLEDKFGKVVNPDRKFVPKLAEEQAHMNLLCRIHDIYVSSPNNTQPGFAHTQGCMYLAPYPTDWCAPERCMDRDRRAAKLAELWKQLNWLESKLDGKASPYMCGRMITVADMTWYPTLVFMEYLLPRNFGWCDITCEKSSVFPQIAKYCTYMKTNHREFADVREGIWTFFSTQDEAGMMAGIREEVKDKRYKWLYTKEDLLDTEPKLLK